VQEGGLYNGEFRIIQETAREEEEEPARGNEEKNTGE
jgi:hypothetical protein